MKSYGKAEMGSKIVIKKGAIQSNDESISSMKATKKVYKKRSKN
jgi:hypothetical protein